MLQSSGALKSLLEPRIALLITAQNEPTSQGEADLLR